MTTEEIKEQIEDGKIPEPEWFQKDYEFSESELKSLLETVAESQRNFTKASAISHTIESSQGSYTTLEFDNGLITYELFE